MDKTNQGLSWDTFGHQSYREVTNEVIKDSQWEGCIQKMDRTVEAGIFVPKFLVCN